MHGLNGDILVWNPITKRRHELSSMGIRVNAETLKQQLALTHQEHFLKFPYHQGIVNGTLPLSIGGGIGQSRVLMLLLRKAHLGRGQRDRVAEGPQGDVREEEHPRHRVGSGRFGFLREGRPLAPGAGPPHDFSRHSGIFPAEFVYNCKYIREIQSPDPPGFLLDRGGREVDRAHSPAAGLVGSARIPAPVRRWRLPVTARGAAIRSPTS